MRGPSVSVTDAPWRPTTAPMADRLVVVTTVGLAVHDGWAGPSNLFDRTSHEGGHSALSPNGEFFALVDGPNPMLEIWNLSDDEPMLRVPIGENAGSIYSLAFDDDSASLTISTSASVTRWSLDGIPNELVRAPVAATLGPATVATDGGVVVPVFGSATAKIIVSDAGAEPGLLDLGLEEQLGRTALSSDGSFVVVELVAAAGPDQNSLAVIDLATGVLREQRIGVGTLTTSMWALGPDDRLMTLQPSTVTIFDIDGVLVGQGELGANPAPTSVSAPSDGETFVTAHEDGSLLVWSLGGERLSVLPPSAGALREIARPDGSHVLTVGFSGRIDGFVLPGGKSAGLIDDYAHGAITSVAISSEGDRLAVAHASGRADLNDSLTGAIEVTLDHDGRKIDAVAWSPDSSTVVTGVGERLGPEAFDDGLTVWDARTGIAESEIGGEGETVAGCSSFRNLVRYSPDGELLAASSHDFTATLYRADDLTPILTLPQHGGTILDIAFSHDGTLLASSSEDLTLRLWDVESGNLIAEHEAALGGYWAIAFAPDDTTLATIGATGSVSLIRASDGQVIRTFGDAANWMSNVAFSLDGSLLVAGGKSDDVLVWQTTDGTVIDRLVGHADRVNAVAIAPDDTYLVSGSEDGTYRRWRIDR